MRPTTRMILASAAGFAIVASAAAPGAFGLQSTKPATTRAATTGPAATMPADAVPLVATITSVKGIVKVRKSENAPWEEAKVGMKLDQGAEIRTALRSAVQFTVGDDQTITLDRLGTVSVLRAFQTQGKATTDLGLKYGRTRYDIKETDLQHESTIRSPGSTLAIRGTDVVYEDQAPWVPQAVSREGRAEFRNYRRQFVAFGGTRRAGIAADKNSPGQTALANTKNDQKGAFAGRTDAEDELNLTLTSVGGVDAQGLQALRALATSFGGEVIAGAVQTPGPLTFVLSWSSTATPRSPTNIDLFVTDATGQTASPLNLEVGSGSSIGRHLGDELGLPGSGSETVEWTAFFPIGDYTVTAQHQGGDDAGISIGAFQSLEAIDIGSFGSNPDPPIPLKAGESFTGTVTVRQNPPAASRVSRARENRAARIERNQAAAARRRAAR